MIIIIKLGSHLVFSFVYWFWYVHFPFYRWKSFQRPFDRYSLCPHYSLVKAVAGEEMEWLLVSLCSLYPYCVPSLTSVSSSEKWGIGVKDDDDMCTKPCLENGFSWNPSILPTRMIGHPALNCRICVSNWFPGDILTTLCPSMWTSSGALHVHPFSWHSTLLTEITIFRNYYPWWGSGHWGRRTWGVTWVIGITRLMSPAQLVPSSGPRSRPLDVPGILPWHGAFLKSWLLGMFSQSEATCQPRALSEMCELQAGRTTAWNSSPTQALLLFIGAFLCLWSPEASSAGPSWGSRGGVCKEGRCHHRV